MDLKNTNTYTWEAKIVGGSKREHKMENGFSVEGGKFKLKCCAIWQLVFEDSLSRLSNDVLRGRCWSTQGRHGLRPYWGNLVPSSQFGSLVWYLPVSHWVVYRRQKLRWRLDSRFAFWHGSSSWLFSCHSPGSRVSRRDFLSRLIIQVFKPKNVQNFAEFSKDEYLISVMPFCTSLC